MRAGLFAAALAALALAAPAPAQTPDQIEAEQFAELVSQRLQQNHGDVRDYSFTLAWGDVRVPIWVHQDDGEWMVEAPSDSPVGELLSAAVLWPAFQSFDKESGEEADEEWGSDWNFRMDRETVDGRAVRVLAVWWTGEEGLAEEMPDSFRLHVDEATSQISRVYFQGAMDEEDTEEFGGRGHLQATLIMDDYQTTDGLTLPRTLHMTMRMELDLDSKERQSLREDLEAAREALAGQESPEAQEMSRMLDLFGGMMMGEGAAIPLQVEEVRVNPGRPSWLRRRSLDKS